MDANTAWSIFIAGFTDTGHARRHAVRFAAGPLAGVRFATGEVNRTPFEAFFIRNCDPVAALATITAHQPLPRHYLTVLADQPGTQATYRRAGYYLADTETLMACDLADVASLTPTPDICLIGEDAADWHNRNDPQGTPWVLPAHLADSRMRHYAFLRDGRLIGRGRNFWLDARHSYVSRIYIAEGLRGQGLARGMMTRLLADDIARGARWSVLTALHMGERLYTGLGYRALAPLLIFAAAQPAN